MRKVISILMVLIGNCLYALSVKLFLLPSSLITGGTTGIGLALRHYTGMDLSTFVFCFNVAMLILGYLVLGKKFALTTIISTFSYPAFLKLFEIIFRDTVLTEDILLCTVFTGLGIGLALGIVIRTGASTGGMDIPPLVLHHYFNIPVSVSMYVFDIIILLAQATFNKAENILYGIILILIYTVVLDKLLLLGTTKTEVKVVSNKADEIRNTILHQLDRGVTMIDAETGYLQKETQIVFSIISNRELPSLEKIIHTIDPEAFMVVTRVSEVSGRGFSMNKMYK